MTRLIVSVANHRSGLLSVTLFVLACIWTGHAAALSSDREQPIELEADSAHIDERTGVSVYTGNVKLTQGSTRLLADRLTVERGEDGNRVVAEGQPATFSQQPDDKPKPVEGLAKTIDSSLDSLTLRVDEPSGWLERAGARSAVADTQHVCVLPARLVDLRAL